MFHVNQFERSVHGEVPSLADAELGEDGAEHLLDVDAPGEPAEMAGGDAKLLGLDFRPSPLPAEALKGLRGGLELGAVAGAGDDRRLADGKPLLGVLRQRCRPAPTPPRRSWPTA